MKPLRCKVSGRVHCLNLVY